MPENEFSAEVEQRNGTTVIQMRGDVDRNAHDALIRAQEAAESDGPIVLDFRHVGYINSTGIALIVGLLASARTSHRPVRAFGLSDHYQQIFEITRISDFMHIYQDENAALQAV